MAYNEFKTASQVNYGWNLTWESTGKFPIIAKRAFETLADAQGYVDDASSSACEGLILSVFNDGKNNGIYLVQSVGDGTNAGVLVSAGQGTGSITSANYEEAVAQATKDNVGQIIYVTEEQTIGDVTYGKGPYIVTGEGTISKLGTTSASGDLAGDVETLKSDVADLEKALENKVSTEGYIAYSQEEKTKLANIADGAQVNVIEKIIFNGEEVVVNSQDKSVSLTTPADVVRGLKDGENILSLDAATGKLGTTLNLEYYTDENNVPYIRLRGINGQIGDAINATNFIKDGMLSSVDIVKDPEGKTGTFIEMTFNTDAGITDPVYVDVSDVFTAYTAGDGIDIDSNVVKVKVYESDKYLTVDVDGIKSKGIDEAITNAKNAIVGKTDDAADALTIYGAKKYADNAVANIAVKSIDTTATSGIALENNNGAVKVTVNNDTLASALVGATGEVGPVSGISVKLGQAIVDGDVTVISETTSVTEAIQNLSGKIQTAIAGGITAIDGGEYITVGGTATSKTLAVNVAKIGTYMADNTSALKVDSTTGKLTLEWEEIN